MKTILQLLLLTASTLVIGQSKTDSIKVSIAQYPDSTELYLKVARPYLFNNSDSAYFYLTKGLVAANNNNSKYEQGRVFDNFGIYYGIQSKYDSAIFFYKKAVANFRELNDEYALANVLNNLGLTLFKKGDYQQSIVLYQEAVDLYTKLDKPEKAARTFNNLGLIFIEINDEERALHYFNTSMKVAKEAKNEQSYFQAMSGKAEIIGFNRGNYTQAIILFDSIYNYFKATEQLYYVSKLGNNLGGCYKKIGNYTKAGSLLAESLHLKKQFGDQEVIISGYESLADLYYLQQNYKLALSYIDSALTLSKKIENLSWVTYNIRFKSDILLETKKYKEAAQLYAQFVVLQDSLNEVEQTAAITELNNKYEVAKKDKELATLTHKNEQQQQEIKLTRIKYIAFGSAIILLAAIIIFYLVQLRQRDKLRASLLNEEMDGLRLRISRIMSDVKLEEIAIEEQPKQNSVLSPLTEREIEILKQAVTNKSNAEIGDILFISPNTVKYHLKNIYTKIGVSSKLEARAYFT